jgi:hypothetical protein
MPLRDHFHAPLRDRRHWEGFHSLWAGLLVEQLSERLPPRCYAEPHTHIGAQVQVGVATFEPDAAQDVFEVRVYDEDRRSRLVAAVELVSPANKDRAEHREAFAVKCAAYLQNQVGLIIVDVVTERQANLHPDILRLLGLTDATLWPENVHLYAVAYHAIKDEAWRLGTWTEFLAVGAVLPTLPLWLAADLAVPVELEPAYERTCRVLRIA